MTNGLKIAVFRALYLGDLLTAVPALRALRRHFPTAEITLIGLPWAESFVRHIPYLDRFVPFEGYPGIDETPVDPARVAGFLAEQRAYEYDIAIQMHGSGEASNSFVPDLGARLTVGYYRGARPDYLTLARPYPDDLPEVRRNLNLVRLLGATSRDTHLEFPLLPEDNREAAALLDDLGVENGPLIGIHPGAKSPARRWPAESYAAAADLLADRTDAQILITGGPGEEDLAHSVAGRMRHRPLIAAGLTSLGGLAALISRLDLLVTNSTGPSHLAEALDVPAVIVFGPADYERWAPLDQSRQRAVREPVFCSPCAYVECPIDHRCMRRITPERVVAVAEALVPHPVRRKIAV